eukprot:TRINITY_DN2941_c0_g1_i7.p1 TRINITY_DN2941_c0_g1~~TRINITY_DN2941_c0_g1_i7.p1  ORF type:complete len:238 (-),score=35.06 TRINITY_DN2941_c0_g1_i7:487-1200(-)
MKSWGFNEAPKIRSTPPDGFVEPMPNALKKGFMTVVKGPRKGKRYYYCLGDTTLYFFIGKFYEKPVGGYLLSQFQSCSAFPMSKNSVLLVHRSGRQLVLRTNIPESTGDWIELLSRQIIRSSSGEIQVLKETIDEVFKMQTVASHLNDPDGWTAFNEFLKKEFCSEGTEFWKSVQTLRLLTGPKDIQTQIETIYETFILDSAPTQLNISGSVFDQLIAIYGNPKKYSIKIFDEAEVV